MTDGTRRTLAISPFAKAAIDDIKTQTGVKTDTNVIEDCIRFRHQFLNFSADDVKSALSVWKQTSRMAELGYDHIRFEKPIEIPEEGATYIMPIFTGSTARPK